MLKTIIIDDEQHCINRLEELLQPYAGEVILLGSFQLYDEALAAVNKLQPDFVFLDVHLGEQTGFDLLKSLPSVNFEVIFTTAYDKYALEAFRFSAVDYLLKPIQESDFQQSIERFKQRNVMKDLAGKFDTLFHNLNQTDKSKVVAIPTSHGLTFLSVDDIVRCEADVNYTHIFTQERQKYTVTKTLKQFEELLESYSFFRVHNYHLINRAHIKAYLRGKGGSIKMRDGSEIEVSVRRKEPFLKRLEQLQILLP